MGKQRKKRKKKQKQPEKRSFGQDALTLLLVLLALTFFALPDIIWTWLTIRYDAPNSGFIALGGAGALVLGVVLPITVIHFFLRDKKENDETKKSVRKSDMVLILLLIASALMIAYAAIALFVPEIYERFNENHVTFSAVSWILAIQWVIFGLVPFSADIEACLRKARVSATAIKRARSTPAGKLWFSGLERRSVRSAITIYRVCFCASAVSVVILLFFSRSTAALTAAGVLLTPLSAAIIPIRMNLRANQKEKADARDRFAALILYAYFAATAWLEAKMTLDLWRSV